MRRCGLSNITGLVCRDCRRRYSAEAVSRCEVCFGALEADYNYSKIRKQVTRKRIQRGPGSIWRYREFLPVDADKAVDIAPGFSPLLRADRLGEALGIKHLFIKNDTVNPTFSCKDRMVSIAVSKAVELDYNAVACASLGNLAHSLAVHAARAGIKGYVLAPSGSDETQLLATGMFAPKLITVNGATSDLNKLCREAMESMPWAFVNVNLRPYYSEGAKTIGFEILEQLGWNLPDHVIVPAASGTTIAMVKKGITEMYEGELVKKPRVAYHAVQAQGCSPIVKAFESGSELIQPETPNTIAKSLSVGNPPDGAYALNTIRDTHGTATGVNDQEMLEGVKLLAESEGIFAEPAGGAAVMAAKKLASKKTFKASDAVVLVITAHGMKTPELMPGLATKPIEVEPTLDSLRAAVTGGQQAQPPAAPGGGSM